MNRPQRQILRHDLLGALALCAALLLGESRAQAQVSAARFNAQRFQPANTSLNYFATESARVLPHLSLAAGFFLNYANTPLGIDQSFAISKHALGLDLVFALGLKDRYELGVALPVMLVQDGNHPTILVGAGLGDVRLTPRIRLFGSGPFAMALSLPIELPTGDRDQRISNPGVSFKPTIVAGFDWSRVGFAINAGARLRTDGQSYPITNVQTLVIDHELMMSAAVVVRAVPEILDLLLDGQVSLGLKETHREEFWFETWGGVRVHLPLGFSVNAGAGPGFGQGVGTPAFRVFGGLQWHLPEKKDTDHDGILDERDQCPTVAEDKDGDRDEDGCPEDPAKVAPIDTDGDGIFDDVDRCVKSPEDKDNFEDEDGCPELDNDQDGILDAQDKCPLEAEDKDAFEDADGCPDPDNDQDGILDAQDGCPLQPETKNNYQDDDGCPDEIPAAVKRFTGVIKGITFDFNKATIRPTSRPTLDAAHKVLAEYADVKVLIRGHTDNRGSAERNAALSAERAEAVKAYLVQKGIDAVRIRAEGVGFAEPIADNRTAQGRERNRRTEFRLE